MDINDLSEVAAGQEIECLLCGETLVRTNEPLGSERGFLEVASQLPHQCWEQLPDDANHLRLD